MIKETTINNVLERQECRIYVTLKTADVAVNTDDFDVYGSATDGRCSPAFSVTTTEKAGQFLVTIPALTISRSAAYTYQICARRKSTGHEWVVLHGTLNLTARVADIKASKINIPEKVIEVTLEPESDLPPEYTPLEYLENLHPRRAYTFAPVSFFFSSDKMRIETHSWFEWQTVNSSSEEFLRTKGCTMIWGVESWTGKMFFTIGQETWINEDTKGPSLDGGYKLMRAVIDRGYRAIFMDGELMAEKTITAPDVINLALGAKYIGVFAPSIDNSQSNDGRFWKGRKKDFKIWKNDVLICNMLPCLDETGAPCMFDTVHQVAFYSMGVDDFTFPQQAEPAAVPFSRRRPVTYAQLTENGVRRLYKVPSGYNGTKEEYAAAHGFKPLVETPEPEEGYWSPQWRETEDEIVLDWVETDPPEELETLNQQ